MTTPAIFSLDESAGNESLDWRDVASACFRQGIRVGCHRVPFSMIVRSFSLCRFAILCLLGPLVASAEVKMPPLFGDHMVLQQGLKLNVWGTAGPGESVTVSILGQSIKAVAGKDGKWLATLAPLAATAQPTEMHVAGATGKLDFQDVLIGDVWLCSGQSNMEFAVSSDHWNETLATADQNRIHIFRVAQKTSLTPLEDCEGKWIVCTKANVAQIGWNTFSAVGYFFAREIQESRKYPVGVIGAYWGGTPAQAWTDPDTLRSNPSLKDYADKAASARDHLADLKEQFDTKTLPAWQKAHDEWNAAYGAAQNAAMAQWKQAAQQALSAHQPVPPQPKPPQPEPHRPVFVADDPYFPANLFDAMIHPLLLFGIEGVIWYQGEANANGVNAGRYATLFPAMISGWRRQWGLGDFPFLFVQLAGYGPGTDWPVLRDAQTKTLTLPRTGMATAIDLGEEANIHPKDKVDVGHRLALAARHVAYREELVCSGPTYAGSKAEGPAMRVAFNHRGGGLVIGSSPALAPKDGKAPLADHLEGFEIAGADGVFVPASARIDADAVVVMAAGVAAPTSVRYGWKGFPEVNLYNREGLPAIPFDSRSTPIIP